MIAVSFKNSVIQKFQIWVCDFEWNKMNIICIGLSVLSKESVLWCKGLISENQQKQLIKFPVSACPQALPVEAGISSHTTDDFCWFSLTTLRRSITIRSYTSAVCSPVESSTEFTPLSTFRSDSHRNRSMWQRRGSDWQGLVPESPKRGCY